MEIVGKVKIEKVTVNGERLYRLAAFIDIAVPEDVPREYLNASPSFCLYGETLIKTYEEMFEVGDLLTKTEVQEFQAYLVAAGNRLTQINRELKKTEGKREHSGSYEFKI